MELELIRPERSGSKMTKRVAGVGMMLDGRMASLVLGLCYILTGPCF